MGGVLSNTASGSLVSAALETAGTKLQSRMLDLVNGVDGQQLAGLLFLFAIATAVITLAVGGNYRWGRYLLVGPPLFFFCTQIRVASNGTQWQFGQARFADEFRDRALRGVMDFNGGTRGGSDVALFFQFWNVFMTDVTQTLIKLPNVTGDDSHMNFLTKIQRYMAFWDFNYIDDENIRSLIRVTMVAECADFYQMKRIVADPHESDPVREYYRNILRTRESVPVAVFSDVRDPQQNELIANLIERGVIRNNEALTCQKIWDDVVKELRKIIRANITEELRHQMATGQREAVTLVTFIKKIYTETSRATSMTQLNLRDTNGDGIGDSIDWDAVLSSEEFESGLLLAVDWVIARSLWNEIWDRNPYADSFSFEGHSGNRATGMGSDNIISDQIATTSNAIQQFNRTEQYQYKGDYINAALSLPHFQGVLLMLLAASYPFFAMAMVLPGRAGAMLLWMGLWAWAKLWDFGFAVVMMIDNMLYAIFPRGPNLRGNDVFDAGRAWVRIMEIDPNYSTATYYNLIATCLFAVPLVTAVLVKKGGSELINAIHGGWHAYSNRLGGSAVAFARSLQAQSYARRFEKERLNQTMKAMEAHKKSAGYKKLNDEQKAIARYRGMLEAGNVKEAAKHLPTGLSGLAKLAPEVQKALLDERLAMIDRQIKAEQTLAGLKASYDYSASRAGSWASERAVQARYYSHGFLAPYYGQAELNAQASREFYNAEGIFKALTDQNQLATIDLVMKGGFAPR